MTEKVYCWGFFWENGERAHLEFPFGPEAPDNIIHDLNDPWMLKAYEHYPNLKAGLEEVDDWSLAFIVVNPPEEKRAQDA